MNIICFHNPDEEYGFLSNWYESYFSIDGIAYSSMEQYMMYMKALCFNDLETGNLILSTNDVVEIKSLGRSVKNYSENIWNGVRQIVIYKGLLSKFNQNEDLKKWLLQTGDSILVECAVKDTIWGIGISMTNPDRLDITKRNGQNLLGYTLMIVREDIRRKHSVNGIED